MKKIIIFIVTLVFLWGCGKDDKKLTTSLNKDRKSIHEIESKKYSTQIEESNYKIEVLNVESITDSSLGSFIHPKYSQDGKHLFFTVPGFHQVWHYEISKSVLEKIVELPQCGKNFLIIENGNSIIFRNKAKKGNKKKSVYSILKSDVKSKSIEIVYSTEKRITVPKLVGDNLYFLEDNEPKNYNLNSGQFTTNFKIPYYFVEDKTLIKYSNSKDSLNVINNKYDFVKVNYSTDLACIFGLTYNNGVVIFDIEANPINIFNKASYATKLLNSNLILYTEEEDDGNKILKSEMKVGFTDSNVSMDLMVGNKELCFYPSWSPTENKISYSTIGGQIKIISFNLIKI